MSKHPSKKNSKTDWDRVDATSDHDLDYTEIPGQTEDFFKNAVLRMPESKAIVTLCLDKDVLDWFKLQGSGYQERTNALLRAYMEAQAKQNR